MSSTAYPQHDDDDDSTTSELPNKRSAATDATAGTLTATGGKDASSPQAFSLSSSRSSSASSSDKNTEQAQKEKSQRTASASEASAATTTTSATESAPAPAPRPGPAPTPAPASSPSTTIISDEDLKERFQRYQQTFEEAEQCLKDLREFVLIATTNDAMTTGISGTSTSAGGEELTTDTDQGDGEDGAAAATADAAAIDDEIQCAKGSVEATFTAYVDLLEDLRKFANDEQLREYNEVRHASACELRRLRKDLEDTVRQLQDVFVLRQ